MTTPRQTVTATHSDTIKAHLMTGAAISKWESYERYQITCLAQRIYDLRKAGVRIQGKSVTKNGKRFELYWIEQEDRVRYMSSQVNTPADVRGTGCGTTNQDDSILASINEATKEHRASHEALAAVNADNGVWVSHDYIDNFLIALTSNAKALNLIAQIVDIEGGAEADKINDYSMDVSDIAMSFTLATSNARLHPNSACTGGTWLARDYLKQIKQSIDGNTNGLGTMVIMAKLANTDLHDGVNEASMRLAELSANIAELTLLNDSIAIAKGTNTND